MKHAMIYGLGTLSVQAVSFVLLPLYTRYLHPSEYGVLQLAYRTGGILNICLMAAGIQQATMNLYGLATDEAARKNIPATMGLFVVMAFSLGAIILWLATVPVSGFLHIENPRLLAGGILAILLQGTTLMPLALLQARMQSRYYTVASVGMALTQLILTILALVILDRGVGGIIAALAVSAGTFGFVLTLREVMRTSFRPDFGMLREAVRVAAPFVPTGLFSIVVHSGDQFFLARSWGTEVVGLYALGYRIASAPVLFAVTPFYQVWSAWMYNAYRHEDGSVRMGRAIAGILVVYVFAALLLTAFAEEILLVLGSPAYAAASRVLPPLVLANFFFTWTNLLDAPFYLKRKTYLKPWITGAAMVVMVFCYMLLIPRHGAQGAAFATLLGFFAYFWITFLVSRRVYPIAHDFVRLGLALAMAVGIGLLTRWLGTALWVMPVKLLLCVLWLVLLWVTGLATREDKDFILATARDFRRRFRNSRAARIFQRP